ncbi:two-component system protein A [Aspergillus lentulus]|nr:two-component system protein A [Aspergillus lentulus]GFG18018.1 two-component system protein A [Aspergillus lentulus]
MGKTVQTSADSLDNIFICTPVPTIVLDSTLGITQVSDSHDLLSELSRENLIGTSIFDVPVLKIPAPGLPVLLGALQTAVSTKSVQVVTGLSGGPSLTLTPIFAASSFIHLVIEVHVGLPYAVPLLYGGDKYLSDQERSRHSPNETEYQRSPPRDP